MSPAQEVANILLEIKAVTLSPNKPYRFTSGLLSPIYTDCRVLISHPKERTRVIELMAQMLANEKPDVIAGTATAGIPHAAWLAQLLGLPMIYVRSKAKDHGKQNQIEGVLEKGQKVIVIEDLISTAKSSIEAVNAIRDSGGESSLIAAIFYYQLDQAKTNLKADKVNLKALTDFATISKIAVDKGFIKAKDEEVVLAWNKDSANWGHAMGFE